MKKAIDQTVRDLKREVNKNILKVPKIEQKVLDATSNEPWGPHGSILADIAQATRNYHEHQIIMTIIWKRLNDTGKNWRHVYKALIVLDYLVAHGSERVIDDIREHSYQISTLSDFQYIDSSGKDQGNNVRRKSQSLVVLVNDKERIQEVREKAAANRDKYRGPPTSNMYRPASTGYGDRYNDDRYEGRYGYRDDDRNGYGRDRDWGSKDDDRYGRYGDSYGREGDRYGRDYEDRYGRDGYRDDDYRGRGQSIDKYNYNSRSRSADPERGRANEGDGQFSSRESGANADDYSQDGRLDHKSSGQNHGAPPSYEDAVQSPTYIDRGGDSSMPNAPKESPLTGASPGHTTSAAAPTSTSTSPPVPASTSISVPTSAPTPVSSMSAVQHSSNEVGVFDEFDPRGSFSAAPVTSSITAPAASGVEMDLFGALSESFSSNSLALVPSNPPDMSPEADRSANVNPGPSFTAASSASTINNQSFNDPFGDGPFKAAPTNDNASIQPQITTPPNSVNTTSSHSFDTPQAAPYMASDPSGIQPPASTEFSKQEFSTTNPEFDILADILPPSAPAQDGYPLPSSQSASHTGFPHQTNQSAPESGLSSVINQNTSPNSFQAQTGQPAAFPTQPPAPQPSYPLQPASSVPQTGQTVPSPLPLQAGQPSQMGFHPQSGSMQFNTPPANFYGTYNSQSAGLASNHNHPQSGFTVSMTPKMGPQPAQVQLSSISAAGLSNSSSTGLAAAAPESSKDKFEMKSSVWADTLSRGLVNLNISGSKTNPLADIGVDFDAINRKEKRMEKQTTSTITSTVTMGKAMGSGSGLGRAGVGALRPMPNPMMNSGMNMGIAGPGASIGMGGYGASQPMGRGMGIGMGAGVNTNMNMPGNMGMGMNTSMGPGMNMQRPMGFSSGSTMPGGYNYMMGTGNYGQRPHGGGYQ